jgi:RNA recognition motif-containing protein
MDNEEEAQKAITELNGATVEGRTVSEQIRTKTRRRKKII